MTKEPNNIKSYMIFCVVVSILILLILGVFTPLGRLFTVNSWVDVGVVKKCCFFDLDNTAGYSTSWKLLLEFEDGTLYLFDNDYCGAYYDFDKGFRYRIRVSLKINGELHLDAWEWLGR